jgi:hypothetical protein
MEIFNFILLFLNMVLFVVNLIFIMVLSRSVVRIIEQYSVSTEKVEKFPRPTVETGLVDPGTNPTYDPRFQQPRT